MNIEINIDAESLLKIVSETLKKDCALLSDKIREYRRKKKLSNVDTEDLRVSEIALEAIKKALRYYTPQHEYERFVKEL